MADQRIEHLLRRAGFGASADDLAIFGNLSYGAAVDRLVNYDAIPDDVDSKIGQPGYVGMTSNGAFSRHDYHHPAAGWGAARSVGHVLEKEAQGRLAEPTKLFPATVKSACQRKPHGIHAGPVGL